MNLFEAFQYIQQNPKKLLINKHNNSQIMRQRGAHITTQDFNPVSGKFYGGVPIYINKVTLDSEWIETDKDLNQLTKELF